MTTSITHRNPSAFDRGTPLRSHCVPPTPLLSQAMILLAVNNGSTRTLLYDGLTQAGYAVRCVESERDLFACVTYMAVELILLHTDLADADVFDLCVKLRAESHVPLILLSEQKKLNDMIDALLLGADDYVALPVTLAELSARLHANLRRAGLGKYPYLPRTLNPSIYLNNQSRTVWIREEEIPLTQIEFRMMYYLLQHANAPVTKEALLAAAWGYAEADEINFLEVAIRRLRQKIELNPSQPEYLVTVRGAGYKLNVCSRSEPPAL
ncbi:MAG: response regulator transcription factor [Caldilineaceae bacterium]|nr:response regulator transcription factor [Caldilineaceae bacterium]